MKKSKFFRSILTLILVATLTLTSILSASAEAVYKKQTPEGYFSLKQIIDSNGEINSSGKKYITDNVDSNTSYSLFNNNDNIEFKMIYKYNSNITVNVFMLLYENGSNSKVEFYYLDTSVPLVSCSYTGSIVPEFTNIERINIDFQHSCTYTTSYLMTHMTSRYTEKESLELANSSFQLAMSAWDYALIKETQGMVTFDELSFSIECKHIGGTANCIEQAICSTCGEYYGTINKNNHKTPTIFKYAKIDENNHKKLYDCCDALAVASEPHIYDNASDMICNGVGCEYYRTHYCGNGVLHSGFAANCSTMTNGEKDYYVCSCGKKYYDATCLSPVLDEADLVIAWEHTLSHHNSDPASCWENGTVEYWSCSKCSKNFGTSNEQDTNALATIVDYATGNHSFGTAWIDGGDGYHYHICTTQGCTLKEEVTKQLHTGGTATCEAAKICSVCTKAYGNKDATNHTSNEFIFVDNGDSTHTKKNKCCNAIVGEPEEHTFGDDNICDICNYDKTHYCGNGTLVKGKVATCTENGVKDSYKCSCGKIYLDATCKTLVTSEDELVIKATGVHTDPDNNNKCNDCEAILDKTVTSPQTADNSNMTLWIALAFVSLASLTRLTIYGKKKRNQA